MKFGKVLLQSMRLSSSAWQAYWVDYKQLKKIIKDCAQIEKQELQVGDKVVKKKVKPRARPDNDSIRGSADEMKFFQTLRSEIKKIADFFVREQARYSSQVAEVEGLYQELKSSPSEGKKTKLMQKCVTMYKELLLLENFAVMNFCGISKILKKHDKWTGYATRHKFMHTILMKQPFSTYCPLLQMINRLEHIFMEITGCSIDQHDSRHDKRVDERQVTSSQPCRTDPETKREVAQESPKRVPHVEATGPRADVDSPRCGVTLVRVQSLRDDAKELEKIERMSTSSVEEWEKGVQNEQDDPGIGSEAEESGPQVVADEEKDTPSADEEKAVSFRVDQEEAHISRLHKRKACSALQPADAKRKMSFATILN